MERTIYCGIRKFGREDVKREVRDLLLIIGGPVDDTSMKTWSYDVAEILNEKPSQVVAWYYGKREDIPAYVLLNLRELAKTKKLRDNMMSRKGRRDSYKEDIVDAASGVACASSRLASNSHYNSDMRLTNA